MENIDYKATDVIISSGSIVVPPTPHPWFCLLQFHLPAINHGLEAGDPPSDISSEVNISLTLHYLIAAHRIGIVSSHVIKGKKGIVIIVHFIVSNCC